MKLSRFLFGIVTFVFGALMFLPGMAQATHTTLPAFMQAATDLVQAPAGTTIMTLAVAGDFSCADLQIVQGKADQIWMDNAANKDYIAEVDTLKAVIANQTAKIEEVSGYQEKDKSLKISWINTCDIVTAALDDECAFDGNEASAQCETYAPNITRAVTFKISERSFRTSTYTPEEVIAKSLLKATKELDEYLTQTVIAQLDTFKGVNTFAGTFGTIVGGAVGASDTEVAAANWNAGLVGYFLQVCKMNKIQSPWLLSGNNLYLAYWNAQTSAANADGKGDINKFQQLAPTFDLYNLDTVLSGDPQTFAISRGAVAFGAKTEYQATPVQYTTQKRYSIPSRNLPGVSYDVYYTNTCVEGTGMVHQWKVITRAGFYLNPVGCTETNTGILSFKNV